MRVVRRFYLLPLLILCSGCLLTVSIFLSQRHRRQVERQMTFTNEAEKLDVALQTALQAQADIVYAVGLLFEASPEITAEEFAWFVHHGPQSSQLQALAWVPLVPYAERSAYETAVFPSFHFTERDRQGRLIAAKQRPYYHPLYFIEPYPNDVAELGYDLGTEATLHTAIEEVWASDKMRAEDHHALALINNQTILILHPVYDVPDLSLTADQRPAVYQGLILGVLPVEPLIEEVRQSQAQALDITLVDTAVPTQTAVLYSSNPLSGSSCAGLCYERSFSSIAQRPLRLTVRPSAAALEAARAADRRPSPTTTAVLFFTLILTSCLFYYSDFNNRLTQGNQTVTAEIYERQKVEARLQQLVDERGHLLYFVHDVASTRTLSELIEHILDGFSQIVPFDACGLYEADGPLLRPIEEAQPIKYDKYSQFVIPLNQGIVGSVFASCSGERVNYAQHDARSIYPNGALPSADEHLLCFPLQAKGDKYGAMIVARQGGASFSDHEFELAQLYVHQVAVVIYNALLQKQIQKHAEDLEQRVLERTLTLRQNELFIRSVLNSLAAHVAVVAADGRILAVNHAWELYARTNGDTYFQYSNPGKNYLDVCRQAIRQGDDSAQVALTGLQAVLAREMAQFTLEYPCQSGIDEYWFLMYVTPLAAGEGGAVILHEDITELKKAEAEIRQLNVHLEQRVLERTAALKQSLDEKDVLLKEIHHRVKNNLQIVSSLLSLQADYTVDATLQQALQESRNRVRSMALIHERLYRSENLSQIDFAQYVVGLVDFLRATYNVQAQQVRVMIDVEPLLFEVATAVPLGLIVNELVSNAYKHAFGQQEQGEIGVRMQTQGSQIELMVRDNGVGLPPGFDWQRTNSLGLTIVQALALQLGGRVLLESVGGTAVTITFTDKSQMKEQSHDKNHGG